MAPKMAMQNIFGTQKLGGAILYISPPLLSGGSGGEPAISNYSAASVGHWLPTDAGSSRRSFGNGSNLVESTNDDALEILTE